MKFCKKLMLSTFFLFAVGQPHLVAIDFKEEFKDAIEFAKDAPETLKEKHVVTLREIIQKIPPLNKLKLPKVVNKFLDGIEFQSPKLKIHEDTYELEWQDPLVLGVKRRLTMKLYIGPGKDGGPGGISLAIGVPGLFTLNTLLPSIKKGLMEAEEKLLPLKMRKALKKFKISVEDMAKIVDWLQFENIAYVLSSKFDDPQWGPLQFGLNLVTTSRFSGPLLKLLNLIGEDLTTLKVRGIATPLLAGTELRGIYPGKFTIFRWPLDPRKPAWLHLRTTDLQLRVGLTFAAPMVPTIKIIGGGFELKLPGQKEYVSFRRFVDFMPLATPPALEAGGQMDGIIKNLFGLPGVNVGNVGFSVTVMLPKPIPQGLSIRGEVHIGPLKRFAVTQIDIGSKEIAFIAKVGKISNKDVIDYALHIMESAAKLEKKDVDIEKLRPLFHNALPPFQIEDCEFYFVPTAAEIFGKRYASGVHVKGHVELWGAGGGLEQTLFFTGQKGMIYLNDIRIPKKNPMIIISGSGRNMKRGDDDDGPIIIGELTFSRQLYYIDGFIEIPALGVKSDTRILITPFGGIEFDIIHRLAGVFEIEWHGAGKPKSLDSFFFKGEMTQEGINELQKLLTTGANDLSMQAQAQLSKAQAKLTDAKRTLTRWETRAKKEVDVWIKKQTAKKDRAIAKRRAKIKKINRKCKRASRLKKAWACKGKVLIPGIWADIKRLQVEKEVWLKGILKGVAKGSIKFASAAAKAGVNAAKHNVNAARKGVTLITKSTKAARELAANIAKGTFNLTKVTGEASLKELIQKGTVSKARVVGTIMGKSFDKTYKADFSKAHSFPLQILNSIEKIF